MSSLTVASLTVITLLFLTGLFENLPEATLAFPQVRAGFWSGRQDLNLRPLDLRLPLCACLPCTAKDRSDLRERLERLLLVLAVVGPVQRTSAPVNVQ
ncbi:MAG TPA: hypothetical protein VFR87_03865 [Nocardioidaceae bacterium]|nr:hypothetical protein [Nocardioidaceae bacterium]